MMWNRKRWLASMLAIAVALGDCGGMTALAVENDAAVESAVSENSAPFDESAQTDISEKEEDNSSSDSPSGNDISEETISMPDTDTVSGTDETDTQEKLPALHIGQIPDGDTLPSPDDDAFAYDLPVSFETADRLILFANYHLETLSEAEENGMLEWSILRGEKNLEAGSACLLEEEDDWDGFEEVSSSPYFTLEEMTDDKSEYYQMMALTSEEADGDEIYDYYIRAAYYPESEEGISADFYAAATIPFLPLEEPSAESDQIAAEGETHPDDSIQEESSISENSADEVENALLEDAPVSGDVTVTEEDSALDTSEILSTLSENNGEKDSSTSPAEETLPAESEETAVASVSLSETQTLIMQPKGEGSQKQITATVTLEPSDGTAPPLTWESSSPSVATVVAGEGTTATITAIAEGYARITASCGGKTASVVVDVVPDTANPDDKLLDLSNEIRVAGFVKESDSLVYTGQKITQDLRVYYNENLLTEKTDYTLSYKNNINAAQWNSAKAPSVTINLKGQYQGSLTLYYTIKPLDINKITIYDTDSAKTPAYEQTVNYSKNLNIPAPVLTFGKKKLAAKKDFVCDYTLLTEELAGKDYKKGDSYEAGRVYHYTVNGTGNYTGSFQMQLVVLNDRKQNFSAAAVKLDKARYDYSGKPLSKSDVKIESLKISGQLLDEKLYDYEVCANGLEGASLTVFPTEAGRTAGYRGCKNVSLKLAGDRKIGDAFLGANWKETIPYSQKTVDSAGGMFQEKQNLLVFKTDAGTEEPLLEGTDYTIKYGNAKKAGTVTVTFKGLGRYTGSVSKKYIITPNSDGKNLTIVWGKNVTKEGGTLKIPYQKGGASPEFYIRDQDYVVLNSKTDYSVKLKDNRTPGTEMTCTITGKNNYKGYEKVVTLEVTKADISQSAITVLDKPYDPKPNKWKSGVTVTDTNGKKLAAKTDYIREIEYSYDEMNPSDPDAVPTASKVITAKVTGTGFYEGTLSGTYRIYDKAKDISKLTIEIDPQTYTGEEIKLDKSDIHVYASAADKRAKKELEGKDSCFEIIESSYKNNIKTGTAKVTLHGIGDYGGTKTYSFKIQKKVYGINRVKGISLDKTKLTASMIELQEAENNDTAEAGKLTATITSQTAETIANPTVIWSSSNTSIATVEEIRSNSAGIDSATQTATAVSTVRIKAKKEGRVTITATTQDGNKRAQCQLTLTNQPVFVEAGQSVKANIGETYELHLKFAQTDTTNTSASGVKWESSNPEAVSVDSSGVLTMNKAGSSVITVSVSKYKFTAQCYAVAIDPNEQRPEGLVLTYEQKPGTTDDTPEINRLLRGWEHGSTQYDCMYIPAGVYHIDAAPSSENFGGIVLTENQTLIMSPSALLIALPNNKSNSRVIWVFGRDNVKISGGHIIGERHTHTGTSGEWGHGIEISGCTNVTIENVEISQCWGDGIYLGKYDNNALGNPASSDITITNCNLHHNRRNNLSVTDASNVTIKNSQFNNAGFHNGQQGHAPQYGIDIEPNPGRTCSNVTISNCTFQGNTVGTIQILGQLNAHVKGVTIENCTGDKSPVIWQGFGGSVSDVTQPGSKWN